MIKGKINIEVTNSISEILNENTGNCKKNKERNSLGDWTCDWFDACSRWVPFRRPKVRLLDDFTLINKW